MKELTCRLLAVAMLCAPMQSCQTSGGVEDVAPTTAGERREHRALDIAAEMPYASPIPNQTPPPARLGPPQPFPALYFLGSDGLAGVNPATTLDPALQIGLRRFIAASGARRAAVVLVSVSTGEVLAAASSKDPEVLAGDEALVQATPATGGSIGGSMLVASGEHGAAAVGDGQSDVQGEADGRATGLPASSASSRPPEALSGGSSPKPTPDASSAASATTAAMLAGGEGLPMVLGPDWPAASLFKIVTAAAYVDGADQDADSMRLWGCSTDGSPAVWLEGKASPASKPSPKRITKGKAKAKKTWRHGRVGRGKKANGGRKPRAGLGRTVGRDASAMTMSLGEAFGQSCNAYFARLAVRKVGLQGVLNYASRFGFGELGHKHLRADFIMPESPMAPPREEDLAEAGRFGAGFGRVALSPLHAAWLSLVVATDGKPPRLKIFKDSRGRLEPDGADGGEPAISQPAAAKLRELMGHTVQAGTARQVYVREEYQQLAEVVGGKTGTLSTFEGDGVVTWFSGMMPLAGPEVVVAAMVVQDGHAHIKGKELAAEALRLYQKRERVGATRRDTGEPLDGAVRERLVRTDR